MEEAALFAYCPPPIIPRDVVPIVHRRRRRSPPPPPPTRKWDIVPVVLAMAAVGIDNAMHDDRSTSSRVETATNANSATNDATRGAAGRRATTAILPSFFIPPPFAMPLSPSIIPPILLIYLALSLLSLSLVSSLFSLLSLLSLSLARSQSFGKRDT
jgi:hypothetical protein